MDALKTANDTLFILLGAIMVLAMHAGFAFLEVGTVRKKNQVNALVKILTDFGVSTIAYFGVGARSDGTLATNTSSWTGWNSAAMTGVINAAHARGVKVVVAITMMAYDGGAQQATLLG